jgi:lipopolysaccharide export system protein LptA
MNRPILTVLLAAGLAATLQAQTNAPAAADRSIDIRSLPGEVEFDLKARVAVYRGNVRVESQGMQLTCGVLTAKFPATGSRVESFVAEEKVVIDLLDEKGQKVHGTGDKLVYAYTVTATTTNEVVELMGNCILETPQGPMAGDAMRLDRINNKFNITNPQGLFREAAASKTNRVGSPKVEPGQPSPSP